MLIPLSGCLCKRASQGIPDEGFIDLRHRHVSAHLHAFRSLHSSIDVSMEGWTDGPKGTERTHTPWSVSLTPIPIKNRENKLKG